MLTALLAKLATSGAALCKRCVVLRVTFINAVHSVNLVEVQNTLCAIAFDNAKNAFSCVQKFASDFSLSALKKINVKNASNICQNYTQELGQIFSKKTL